MFVSLFTEYVFSTLIISTLVWVPFLNVASLVVTGGGGNGSRTLFSTGAAAGAVPAVAAGAVPAVAAGVLVVTVVVSEVVCSGIPVGVVPTVVVVVVADPSAFGIG